MLSYRHAFHAGNHADVLKHIVWQQVLLHLNRKDKPYCVIDTHAGAGMYRLQSAEAQKTAEYIDGVAKLVVLDPEDSQMPEVVVDYLAAVQAANASETLEQYPGSPWFTTQALRWQDRAWFCELHPKDFPLLTQTLETAEVHRRKVKALRANGFVELVAKLPPQEKRGAVLIDPSYEVKDDYQRVVEVLKQAHKRFASGSYALWYPVVERRRIQQMERALVDSGIPNIHQFELAVRSDAANAAAGEGMTASGMIVINPPWTLPAQMQETLPWLANTLAGPQGRWKAEVLVPE
jgi:23S rRNA (adenine2030-N6)-methyltransferase